MKELIEQMIDKVEWIATPQLDDGSGLPHSTHEGVLDFFGTKLRCYRLSDGRAIFHADDVKEFFGL